MMTNLDSTVFFYFIVEDGHVFHSGSCDVSAIPREGELIEFENFPNQPYHVWQVRRRYYRATRDRVDIYLRGPKTGRTERKGTT